MTKYKIAIFCDGELSKDKIGTIKQVKSNIKSSSAQLGIHDVYKYIQRILQDAKANGSQYIELVSGDIHKDLGLVQRMPTVCDAMYKLMKTNEFITYSPPKGKGSKLHIKYDL